MRFMITRTVEVGKKMHRAGAFHAIGSGAFTGFGIGAMVDGARPSARDPAADPPAEPGRPETL
jgi:hypothetical protein